MKKIICVFMSAVMACALTAGSVYGSSANTLNKTRIVRDGAEIDDVYLKIVPKDEVATGDTIILTYTNAEVLNIKSFGSLQGGGKSFSSLKSELYSKGTKTVLTDLWNDISDNYIPWDIKKITKKQIEVELFPIPNEYCGNNLGKHRTEPFYYIPLSVTADSENDSKDITVTIDSNETSIKSGTYTFATMPLEGSSETNVTITTDDTVTTEPMTEETTEETDDYAAESVEVRVPIGNNEVKIGGKSCFIDAAAYIQAETSSTLVPLRFVALAICGGDVENADTDGIVSWDAETKTALVNAGGSLITFTAGSSYYTINGELLQLENGVKAEIKDGRMYIPFRALGDALGAEVSWEAETKTAVYKIGLTM